MVKFKPLSEKERAVISDALTANAESGGNVPIEIDPKDTSFRPTNRIAGLVSEPDTPAPGVFDKIKSVPVHY